MQIELLNEKRLGGELLKSLPSGWQRGDNEEFGIASAEVRDSDGDIVRISGVSLDRHKVAPLKVFGKAHKYSSLPDGTPSVAGVVNDFIKTQLSVRGTVVPVLAFKFAYAQADGELTGYAKKIKPLVKSGVLDSFSVGIDPSTVKAEHLKGGRYDIKECDIFEISLTPIPKNPYATVLKSLKDGLGEDFDADEYIEAQIVELRKSVDASCEFHQRLMKRLDDIESAIVAVSEAPAGQTSNRQSPQFEDQISQLQKSLDDLRASVG